MRLCCDQWDAPIWEKGSKDFEQVEELLRCGAVPNQKNEEETPLLCIVAKNGTVEMLGKLLKAGADIESEDSLGCIALFYAYEHRDDYVENMEFLLKNKANVNKLDGNGERALFYIIMHKYQVLDAACVLINHGIDLNHVAGDDSESVLFRLVELPKEVFRFIKVLIPAGLDINLRNKDGSMCLDNFFKKCSKWSEYYQIIEILLRFGGDSKIKDNSGVSVFESNEDSHVHFLFEDTIEREANKATRKMLSELWEKMMNGK